jgi:hypothetical protein
MDKIHIRSEGVTDLGRIGQAEPWVSNPRRRFREIMVIMAPKRIKMDLFHEIPSRRKDH